MADRNFIIEVLLRARDDTARAFASAAGQMEAYDKLIDEQRTKNDALVASNGRLTNSYKKVRESQGVVAQGHDNVLKAQQRYQKAADDLARRETQYRQGDIASARRLATARQELGRAEKNLAREITKTGEARKKFDVEASRDAARVFRDESRKASLYKEQSRILSELETKTQQIGKATDARQISRISSSIGDLRAQMSRLGNDTEDVDRAFKEAFDVGKQQQFELAQRRVNSATKEYQQLVDRVAQAERNRDQALSRLERRGATPEQVGAVTERLDVDVRAARAHLEEFRLSERAHAVNLPVHLDQHGIEREIQNARLRMDALGGGGGGGGAATATGGGGAFSNIVNWLKRADTSVSGFGQHLRSAFGFAAISLIQPLAALLVGLAGSLGALASAAVAAGSALGVTFLSAVVQGIPALGLFAAAMQRLTAIFGYVQQLFAQQQQRFIAQYQAAYQNALGINQVTIAEHGYSDALYAVGQAERNVTISELALRAARQQATRQLQDLVLQEEAAKLAAEASSLAVRDAQKSLLATVATGGDVQQAQLQLQQAHVGHVQATVQAQRAVTDAARGSISRQQINEQVVQARQAVEQARRAVVDANFAAAQARAAIIEARQAAAGFNIGVAAQMAWLRSQMSATERALAANIQKIFGLFQGANSEIRHFTDQILGAFVPITARIYQILRDPRMIAALTNLSRQIGNAFRTIFNTLLSNRALQGFISLINAAAANMAPFARIVSDFFKSVGAIAQAAIPFVHQFLNFIARGADRFASWASSSRGQNWLANFFRVAFKSLEAFVKLGGAFIRLFAAVIGEGGGAKTGIGLINDLTKHVNRLADSINNHGRAFRVLHMLWASAKPTLHDLGIVIGAIGHGLLELGASKQGQDALKALADLSAKVLVPAFVQFAKNLGQVIGDILVFLQHHPAFASLVKDFIAWSLTFAVAAKGVRLLFGPLAALAKIFMVMVGGAKILGRLLAGEGWKAFGGPGASIRTALETGGNYVAEKIRAAFGSFRSGPAATTAARGPLGGIQGERGSIPELPVYVWVVNNLGGGGPRIPGEPKGAGGAGALTAEEQAAKRGAQDAARAGEQVAQDAKSAGRDVSALRRVRSAVGDFVKKFPGAQRGLDALNNLRSHARDFASKLPEITRKIPGVVLSFDALRSLGTHVGNFAKKVPELTRRIPGMGKAFDALKTVGEKSGEFVRKIPGLSKGADHAAGALKTAGDHAGELAKKIPGVTKFAEHAGGAAKLVGEHFGGLATAAFTAYTLISTKGGLKDKVKAATLALDPTNLLNIIGLPGISSYYYGKHVNPSFTGYAGHQFPLIIDKHSVSPAMQSLVTTIPGVRGPGPGRTTAGAVGGNQVFNPFALAAQPLLRTMNSLWVRLHNDVAGQAKKMGQGVRDGLTNGIKGVEGALTPHISRMVHNARNWLQIRSPSRVMEAMGSDIVNGLSRGIGGVQNIGHRIGQLLVSGLKRENFKGMGRWVINEISDGLHNKSKDVSNNANRYIFDPIRNAFGHFKKDFSDDWKSLWKTINDITSGGVNTDETDFDNLFNHIRGVWGQIRDNTRNSLQNLNDITKNQLSTLFNNFKNAYGQIDQDTFNAFWYIQHAANQSLKAFNAKPVQVTLGALPKLSGGGFLGAVGEKGRDAVPALLGRGEAVLNWAHQRVVEPAMRAYYGFGLDKMFQRVRTAHAGAEEGGYAAGGYAWPFGGPVTWERTDQGVDFSMQPGTPIGPIGKAKVIGINPNWYKGQPFVWWQLLDGPEKGKYAFVSEQITNIARPGTVLNANQAVARFASSGTGIEYGFATASGQTLAQATTGYKEGQVTPAGSAMRALLTALSLGKQVSILGGLGGLPGAGAAIKLVKDIHLKGSGALQALGQKAIERVRKAANDYLGQQGGGPGGVGVPGGLSGPVPNMIAQAARKLGFNKVGIAGLIGNAVQESQLNPAISGGGAAGLFQWTPPTALMNFAQQHHKRWQDVGLQVALAAQTIGRAGINAMNSAGSPAAAALWFMNNFERPGIPAAQNRINAAIAAFAKGYAGGGFAGGARPILAHVGEWVVNQAQQSKLAGWLGTNISNLKGALGFTGGPDSFQGGGEVGHTHTTHQKGTTDTTYRFRGINVRISLDAGSVNKEGVYTPPKIAIDSGPFYQAALSVYSRAQKATVDSINRQVRDNAKKLNDAVAQFLKNYNLVGGENGIFALASQAIADYTTQQQNVVALAAAGFRLIRERLTKGVVQTAVQAAQADLNSTNRIVTQLEGLHRQELIALREIDREIRDLGRNAAKTHPQQYQQLIGARNDVVAKLRDVDSTLAQAISDRYTKAAALFQAQIDHALRIPTLRLGTAQMFQQIAQTLGQTGLLHAADEAIISSYQEQVTRLQTLYREASRRAAHDPRWQTVADQLAAQLQEAVSSLVQAQAQALQDAITAEDTKAQIQQVAVDVANRMADVQAALGNQLGAAFSKIGTSRTNVQNLLGQRDVYQGLLTQAQAVPASERNIQIINDLTQKISELDASIAEANLQTQQLIVAYRELSISILQTQISATSGFFSAANQISQTLGAIAGNQNLVALISYAKEAGQALLAQAQQIVANINATMTDPNQPFGAFQAQANTLLTELVDAFQKGPQQFADALAQLAPQLATFEALLPPDEQTLFQNLVQAMTDNTTSTVDNTQQLQQLNATSLQQQFQSSAWTMFREAIFNGLGGLLPNYALSVPSLDVGGHITRDGLLYGHTGEDIVPANVAKGTSGNGYRNHIDKLNFNIDHPLEVADPVLLGNAVAWKLAHDPNTR